DAVAPAEIAAALLLGDVFGHEAAPSGAGERARGNEKHQEREEERDRLRRGRPREQRNERQKGRLRRNDTDEQLEPAADTVDRLDGEKLRQRAEELREAAHPADLLRCRTERERERREILL